MRFLIWLFILAGVYVVGMGVSGRGLVQKNQPMLAESVLSNIESEASQNSHRLHTRYEFEPQVIADLVRKADQLVVQIESGEHEVGVADIQFAQELAFAPHTDLQLAALRVLWFLPTTDESFATILEVIKSTTDEIVLEMSLQHTKRFSQRADFDARLQEVLVEQIRQGLREDTSIIAAHSALQYLSPQNIQSYQKLAHEMKPFPRRHKALVNVIEAYEQQAN